MEQIAGLATEKQRDVAEKVMDAAQIPGADAMGAINAAATVNKGVGELEKGDLANGVCDAGSDLTRAQARDGRVGRRRLLRGL